MDRFSGSLRRRYKYILIEPPLPDVLNQGPKNGPLLLELACDGFSKIKRNTKRNNQDYIWFQTNMGYVQVHITWLSPGILLVLSGPV